MSPAVIATSLEMFSPCSQEIDARLLSAHPNSVRVEIEIMSSVRVKTIALLVPASELSAMGEFLTAFLACL
jgi:hypothetical protein